MAQDFKLIMFFKNILFIKNIAWSEIQNSHILSHGEWTVRVDVQTVQTLSTRTLVRRLTAHETTRSGWHTNAARNLSQILTAHGEETRFARNNGLGHVQVRPFVSAHSSGVNTASRLAFTTVGEESRASGVAPQTQGTTVGQDCLDILGIGGGQTFSWAVDVEQRSSGVCCENGVDATLSEFTSKTSNVRSQTVANDVHIVDVHAASRHQEVDELTHDSADLTDTVAGGNVVDSLGTRSPVHSDHIEFTAREVGALQHWVRAVGHITVPSVNGEAGRAIAAEVGVDQRWNVVEVDALAHSWVGAGEQEEDDIVDGVEVGIGLLFGLIVAQVHHAERAIGGWHHLPLGFRGGWGCMG
jgi:hypothetical protein